MLFGQPEAFSQKYLKSMSWKYLKLPSRWKRRRGTSESSPTKLQLFHFKSFPKKMPANFALHHSFAPGGRLNRLKCVRLFECKNDERIVSHQSLAWGHRGNTFHVRKSNVISSKHLNMYFRRCHTDIYLFLVLVAHCGMFLDFGVVHYLQYI